MRLRYLSLVGILISLLLISGCSIPIASSSKTNPNIGAQNTADDKNSPSVAITMYTPDTPETTDSSICFIDNTRFHWVEYSIPAGPLRQVEKYEYTTGIYESRQANLERRTISFLGGEPMLQSIFEIYSDNSENILGYLERQITPEGNESVKKIHQLTPLHDMYCFPRNSISKSKGTETVTVHAGTYICDKYIFEGGSEEDTIYISPEVPVPIKAFTWELWDWG